MRILCVKVICIKPRNHFNFNEQLQLKPDCLRQVNTYGGVLKACSSWKQQIRVKLTLLNVINLTNTALVKLGYQKNWAVSWFLQMTPIEKCVVLHFQVPFRKSEPLSSKK